MHIKYIVCGSGVSGSGVQLGAQQCLLRAASLPIVCYEPFEQHQMDIM